MVGRNDTPGQRPDFFTTKRHVSMLGFPASLSRVFASRGGSKREDAVRFREEYREHFDRSRDNIRSSALHAIQNTTDRRPRALILGAGNCSDIPLEDLVKKFSEAGDNSSDENSKIVTLVDIDEQSMRRAVRELEPDLQKRVEIVVADITGIGKTVTQIVEEAKGEQTHSEYVTRVSQGVYQLNRDFPAETPSFGNEYTFVCSSLLMSQLKNSIVFPFNQYSHRYSRLSDTDIDKSIKVLERTLQRRHIALLAQSVLHDGEVYVADTFHKTTLIGNTLTPRVVLDMNYLTDIISDNFDIVPYDPWQWEVDTDRTIYNIFACSLSLKK